MRSATPAVARILCALVALVLVTSVPLSIGHTGSSTAPSSGQSFPTLHATSGVSRSEPPALHGTHLSPLPASSAPASAGIDPYDWYAAEPAPMGIADYGVTASGSGAYTYSSPVVQGVVTLEQNVQVSNASLGARAAWFGTQLNVMLVFSNGGTQFVYWVQDVAIYDTSSGVMLGFEDNIWNDTAQSSQMYNSTVSGNGTVESSPEGGYYSVVANSSLPGAQGTPLGAGASFTLEMDATETNGGQVAVVFQYADWSGEFPYDVVAFPWTTTLSDYYGFVVSGATANPTGHPYDLELTFGGPGGGSQTTDVASDLKYQLLYWNGHNFQSPENAFNFGDQTAEGALDVQDYSAYNIRDGNLTAQLVEGTGASAVLGQLYSASLVGQLNFSDPSANGTLTVNGVVTPFFNGGAFVVLYPASYYLNVTVGGVTTALGLCTLKAGIPLNVSPASPCSGGSSSTSGPPNFLSGSFASIPVYLWLVVLVVVVALVVALVASRSSRRLRRPASGPPGGSPSGPAGVAPWSGVAAAPSQGPPTGWSPPPSAYPTTSASPAAAVAAPQWTATPTPAAPPAPPPMVPPPVPAPVPAVPFCINCGRPTTYVAQYGRYYCYPCSRYV